VETFLERASYHPGHHRFAIFVAVAVFILIIAGALVTSNDAGLAVPDWPTSFGSLHKIPPMVGGVKFEHGHRMIAEFIGLLTIAFAIWTQLVDERSWMRRLAWGGVALVVVQGILGGITVLMLLPWYVSSAHALFAQTFFSLTIMMALFTSRSWVEGDRQTRVDDGVPSVRQLAVLSLLAVYVQLFLGAAFRHNGMHFLPHIIGAVIATAILLWAGFRSLISFGEVRPIRGAAIGMLSLLVIQLGLGFGAYLTRVEWGRDAVQPMQSMVWTTVAHVAFGALLLAHCFLLAVQVIRYTHTSRSASPVQDRPKVVTA